MDFGFSVVAAGVAMLGSASCWSTVMRKARRHQPAPPPAEKFKNIRILKNIPADQLIPSMQFISASLGVECDFCHTENAGKMVFDKDDKKEKKTARKMMEMMFAINKNNFDGEREVTCNTCHRGAAHPQGIPTVVAEMSKPETEPKHEHATKLADMPSGAPVLAKYIEALGGTAALGKVNSRVEKGKAITPDGPGIPITIYTQAPDKRVSVMHTPKGDSVTAYNGQGGWLSFPGRPLREMSSEDQMAAKIDAESFYPEPATAAVHRAEAERHRRQGRRSRDEPCRRHQQGPAAG